MKKNKSIIALAMAAMMLIGTACGTTSGSSSGSSSNGSDTLKVAKTNSAGGEPGTLQPGLSQGTHESWILDHMYKGLYTKTPTGEIELAIAESAEVSEDGKTWTFKIRDFKWSTGNQGSANDFVEAIVYTLDPANAAKYAANLWILEGGEEFNTTGNRDALKVKAIDDKTLEITLKTPLPYFPDLLTNTFFYPIDSANAEQYPDWFMSPDHYSSNGPFVLTKWVPKEEIVISKNANYYNADKTNLDELHFSMVEDKTTEWQMYEQGQLDLAYSLLPDVIEKLSAENNPELTLDTEFSTYYYVVNTDVKPFNNAKVRKALGMAIDRNTLVTNVTKGGQVPAYTLTPPGVIDENGKDYVENLGPLFDENMDEARKLLAEGLAEEGMDINSWSFKLLYNTNDTHKKVAEAIQSMWSTNLGVNCVLENAEFQTVLDRRTAGDFEVVRAGWVGDYVDPMTFSELFTSTSEFNDGNWVNADYDKFINDALYNQDLVARSQDLKDAETILMEEMGIIPIYYYAKQIATKPNLTGVYTPVNKYPNFEFADITK